MKNTIYTGFALAAALLLFVTAPGCLPIEPEEVVPTCVTGGCSGQFCYNEADYPDGGLISTCEWKPEYACIKKQKCGAQGDSCGWTPTAESEKCFAELKCSVFGYAKVKLADLQANMKDYDQKQIMVCSSLKREPMMCTLMACSPQNPCCNSCGGGVGFNDYVSVTGKAGEKHWGCGGDSCVQTCYPFDEKELGTHRCYYGIFAKSQYGDYGELKVNGYKEGCK